MSKFIINRNDNYVVMGNYHLRDKGLSLKAKGLLSLMFSLPNKWDYSLQGLIAINKENETAITNILKELKELNYLNIKKTRNDKGTYEYIYDIYEMPYSLIKPNPHYPGVENPGVDNEVQINIDNKVLNNKENIKRNHSEEIKEIVDYLNNIAFKENGFFIKKKFDYKPTTPETIKLISGRLNEGYNVDQCKDVIYYCYTNMIEEAETKNKKMGYSCSVYYKPNTIFRPSNFENYLNQYNERWRN